MPIVNLVTSAFPTYILPAIPFRRRSSTSTTSSASSDISASAAAGPAVAQQDAYLSPQSSLLRCNRCLAQISSTTNIISKGFTGRHGRAYLVGPDSAASASPPGGGGVAGGYLPNTNIGRPQQRQLVTGLHTVCDITCALCGSVLGWKYVAAEEEGQKYKVGKFILETKRVMRDTIWDGDLDDPLTDPAAVVMGARPAMMTGLGLASVGEGAAPVVAVSERIEFDSENEDECEDLFMGIWSEKLASKRRKDRAWRMDG